MDGGKESWLTKPANLAKDTGLLKLSKKRDRGMRNTIRHVWRWRKGSGKKKGDSYRITPLNVKYNFEWSTPSKKYSYIYHYPKNIKEDWLALLKEYEQMLVEDGIIQDDNQKEVLEELQEKQSGGMQMV